MPPPVQYDFTAAAELISALRYLHEKVTDLHDLRRRRHDADLECPDTPGVSVPWRGRERGVFDADFQSQQAQLGRLAGDADALLKAVRGATENARLAQRRAG